MACNFKSQSTDHKKTKKSRTRCRFYLNPIKNTEFEPKALNLNMLKVPLTQKFFISRQKSSFCSDHIGEKIIVVRFFLDFL